MFGCKMFLKKSGGLELEEFYPVRPECRNDVPKPRFRPRTGKTLSVRKWESAFSGDGHLDIARVLRRIQLGGVHPAIKGAVWEFLLGCFDPNSTSDERNKIREQRREQHSRWKAECQKMAPIIGSGRVTTRPIINEDGTPLADDTASLHCDGSAPIDDDDVHNKRGLKWKLMVHQIGLDVVRTDRALEFYETEANQAKLFDVLAVYAWMDQDIGYVQGMSDICSPMVILLENEADSFWCFERAMRRLRGNFRCTSSSIGVQSQLSTLSQIMRTVDPKLHQHLEDLDGGEYLFAFRMLMVLFRREFSFVDALYLWELIWAMEYNPKIFLLYEESRPAVDTSSAPAEVNKKLLEQYGKFERKNVQIGCVDKQSTLAVFLAASILEAKNKKLLKEAKGLDDVVKILGDMTGKLDAKKACNDALKIHKKYLYKTKQS